MIQLLDSKDYHSQRNNKEKPHFECGNTSVANLLYTKGYKWRYTPTFMGLDDYVYTFLREKICQQYALTGLKSEWASKFPEQSLPMLSFVSTLLSGVGHIANDQTKLDDIDYMINQGIAVLIATRFYQGKKNQHFVCITGKYSGGYLIADPYGNPLTSYKNHKGYGIEIPTEVMKRNFDGLAVYRS